MGKRKSKSDKMLRTCNLLITFTFGKNVSKLYTLKQIKVTLGLLHEFLYKVKFEGEGYCEATQDPCIHYHLYGSYEFPSDEKFPRDYLKNQLKDFDPGFGFVDIRLHDNEPVAYTYIAKDKIRSMELFDRHHIWHGKEAFSEFEDGLEYHKFYEETGLECNPLEPQYTNDRLKLNKMIIDP